MKDTREVLDRFPAARVERILVEIAAKKKIEVSLALKSGAVIEGRVIDARREGPHGTVLLQKSGADEVVYVELASIEAVSIKNASRYADALSFGAVEDAPNTPAPKREELDAAAIALAERTGGELTIEIAWPTFEVNDAALRSLAEMLRAASAAFAQLSLDASGRAQLASIRRVSIERGDAARIDREGSELRIICQLDRGRAGRVDAIGLLTAIAAST